MFPKHTLFAISNEYPFRAQEFKSDSLCDALYINRLSTYTSKKLQNDDFWRLLKYPTHTVFTIGSLTD